VSELEVFTGTERSEPRDLSDIIFVTDSYSRVLGKHVRNVVPVSTFMGSKKDFSLVALTRYLKQGYGPCVPLTIRKSGVVSLVKDVRDKIQQDFKTTDFL